MPRTNTLSRTSRANVEGQATRSRAARPARPRLTLDEAFMTLLIAAMEANQHTSAAEAARAHHIIWSMKRFRRKSGETVGRLIEDSRSIVEARGVPSAIDTAAAVIPARLRSAAFAVACDLILADGRIEPAERRFLHRLADDLGLDHEDRKRLLGAMLVKNSV
jgi:uncharacterized tellurite resistance protein B-like protein